MRRYACILSVSLLVSTAALVVCAAAGGQKKTQVPATAAPAEGVPLKENAPLAETLSWLNDNLVRHGRFTLYQPLFQPGYRVRTRFLGLEADGCAVTYRVRYELLGSGGGGDVVGAPNDGNVRRTRGVADTRPNNCQPVWADGPDVDVRTVDLAALDPTLVKANTPKKWDGGSVIFGAGGGKAAVSYKDRCGKLMESGGGEFYVSEKERVGAIAGALRHAVALCRE